MSTAVAEIKKARVQTGSWLTLGWVAALIVACYFPVIQRLVNQWSTDDDMGHGFFVPLIAGWIVWQKLSRGEALPATPDWRGLIVVAWGAMQLYVATIGAELFLARTALVITIIGSVWLLCGIRNLRIFGFPLFLLFFMVPIPTVVYTSLTFPLQIFASKVAESSLDLLGVPVMRQGNVLELTNMKLNVVDACSGIRSLLSLTFLSLVYGYFFEANTRIRVLLFLSTIPVAIAANAGRVTITGLLSQINPSLAEGVVHEAEGWVIFMIAIVIMVGIHQLMTRTWELMQRRHSGTVLAK